MNLKIYFSAEGAQNMFAFHIFFWNFLFFFEKKNRFSKKFRFWEGPPLNTLLYEPDFTFCSGIPPSKSHLIWYATV